jgi:hypothetical protein
VTLLINFLKLIVGRVSCMTQSNDKSNVSRRGFLGSIGSAIALGLVGGGKIGGVAEAHASAASHGSRNSRKNAAMRVRMAAANLMFKRRSQKHKNNGEEKDYGFIANFHKGLPSNELGEVDKGAYQALLKAINVGSQKLFEQVPMGGEGKLRNPLAGMAFDLEGPDTHDLFMVPAPRFDQPRHSAEMAELYWHALARDVNFTDYSSSSIVSEACSDLSRLSDCHIAKLGGVVAPQTIFRGTTKGNIVGPYVSQFLLKDVPYGSQTISHRQKTVVAGQSFMTDYDEWLRVQRGEKPASQLQYDPVARYIRNGRDLAEYVHVDALYQAYLNACLILMGLGAPVDSGNPYLKSNTMDSFGTFGGPHILSLVTEVATRALKAVWFQKWNVHRRIRPEGFGGRIHNHLTGRANYPINGEILDSRALDKVFAEHGSYLLPQAYPEGSPFHPAYASGHATVAGACVTILKAWFDEDWTIPNPVVPNADGTELRPYNGIDANSLTVGGELNKVATNIAMGRNFAGIHWRTDGSEGMILGEEVAIGILKEQSRTYREKHSFSFTRFSGEKIVIGN